MKRRKKTLYCYLDGKRHCDVVQWALAANATVNEAKAKLIDRRDQMNEEIMEGWVVTSIWLSNGQSVTTIGKEITPGSSFGLEGQLVYHSEDFASFIPNDQIAEIIYRKAEIIYRKREGSDERTEGIEANRS